jgi:ParB-like chromosome segregation protein Spo0J
MLDGINKKVNFEPVVLQQLDFETYSIIDGRHRIVGSILNGYKYIPAIISN